MDGKKTRVLFGLVGALVLGGLVYVYFLAGEAGDRWPVENAPGSLVNQNGQLRQSISSLRAQEAQIPARREALAAITVEYDLAATVLPRESSPDQLIAAIRTKAEQAGVVPTSLQPSVSRPAAGRGGNAASGAFEVWRFSLAIGGSYDQIATFVNRMEEFESGDAERTGGEKRFFEVRDISIEAQDRGMANLGGGTGEPVRHRCTLVMQTYRYTGE